MASMLRSSFAPLILLLASAAAAPVDFVREVQPIFREHCLSCHGPEKQKSDYRVDVREVAIKGGESGEAAIVPGKSSASPLIHFVTGEDADLLMPPKKSDQARLSETQIAVLRAWIDEGAAWPESATTKTQDPRDWWSLKPIVRPPLSKMDDVENPIDVFIRAKLAEKSLAPAPEADPRTLCRRLYFDLTGLPPTPEEMDAFEAETVRDPRSATRDLTDRLLDSPRYGERWARHWLDVVHFGETHGYDKDKPRPNAWPYRDYVIRAFNADKPYARFVQEQLAGDVLFPDTRDGIEALGFIAAGPWDLIGHMEVPESKTDGKIARHLDRDDMVSNTINTFCSLTVHCAQCHHHKFDPIPQTDYYALQADFSALDRTEREYFADDALNRRSRELLSRQQTVQQALAAQDEVARRLAPEPFARLAERLRGVSSAAKAKMGNVKPDFGYHGTVEKSQDVAKWVQVDLGQRQKIDRVVLRPCYDDFAGIGAGFGFPVRFKIEASDDPEFRSSVVLFWTRYDETFMKDFRNPRLRPFETKAGMEGIEGRYVRVTAVKLAPRKNDFIFALAELEVFDEAGTNLAFGKAVGARDSIEAPPRWRKTNLTDGLAPEAPSEDETRKISEEREALILSLVDEATRAKRAALRAESRQIEEALAARPVPRVVYSGAVHAGAGNFRGTGADGGRPRPIFLLARGDVNKPGEPVEPGALSAVPGLAARFSLPADAPEGERRAALARWITDPRNPLTWRSIVNRVWQYHFGRGLVDSPNDFGRMGQLPSHPELLDWLAAEFREGGGSFKALHRLVLSSATYRQAVVSDARSEAIDSGNALLWRQNRRKLEAEAIRDSLLAVAGKLDLTMGGPSFQDFVIEKPAHSPQYRYDLADPAEPKLQRRSIYRFLVRSQQQPFMAALDCADPSMLVEKRNQTLTPLQALAQLNNQLALAMAKHFAARVETLDSTTEGRITTAYRLALGREPAAEERDALSDYSRQYGLANACRVILNLNEFTFVD
jgi:mono/diheme cytochrome c family protein